MFELIDSFWCVATQIFDRVLVTQPVGALHGVEHVPAPVVVAHVAKGCSDPALCGDRVRSRRKHFGHAGGRQAGLCGPERCPQPGTTGADNHNVVSVINDRVSLPVDSRRRRAIRFSIHRSSSPKVDLQHGKH